MESLDATQLSASSSRSLVSYTGSCRSGRSSGGHPANCTRSSGSCASFTGSWSSLTKKKRSARGSTVSELSEETAVEMPSGADLLFYTGSISQPRHRSKQEPESTPLTCSTASLSPSSIFLSADIHSSRHSIPTLLSRNSELSVYEIPSIRLEHFEHPLKVVAEAADGTKVELGLTVVIQKDEQLEMTATVNRNNSCRS